MDSIFDRQLKRLSDLGTRQVIAAQIGDIFSIKRHALDTIEMTDTIESEWQKHRHNSMYPLDDPPVNYAPAVSAPTGDEFTGNPPADNPPPGASPTEQVSTRCRVVVVRHGCGLLCDDEDPGDIDAAVTE